MTRNCRGVSRGNRERSGLKLRRGSKGGLGSRGARILQGNWSSGGSTSRRSQEAAMDVMPGEEGGSGGKREHKALDYWGR
jgi:hypothetical protein